MTAGGESAFYSGDKTLGVNNALNGDNCVAAGNLLADPNVIVAMINAFEQQTGIWLTGSLLQCSGSCRRRRSRPGTFISAVDCRFSRLADS
jgi:uncharacterized Ntn-hydrolase superfamily protein